MIRGEDTKSIWIDVLQDAIQSLKIQSTGTTGNAGAISSSSTNQKAGTSLLEAPHLDLLVRSKGFNLTKDHFVLNARSYITGNSVVYAQEKSMWRRCNLVFYLGHPHYLMDVLLHLAHQLALAAAEEQDSMQVRLEEL